MVRYADQDGPSWRTVQRRRESDLEFLTRIRTAELEELIAIRNQVGLPLWRQVATQRAIERKAKEVFGKDDPTPTGA